jgi:adenosine kinase
MSALICGSIAYDNIMVFEGRFKEHILPDQIHILNVAFLVPDMRKEFGGCAGNIAYNMELLGERVYALATVGTDFAAYRQWMNDKNIDTRFITEVPGTLTAQAYITTDLDDNQITAFHPGAMDHSHLNSVPADVGIKVGMVSPDGRDGMLKHASQLAAADIPFVFDPGQGLPMFNGDELRQFIDQASWVAVNDYEGQMLQERTGWDEQQIAEHVEALIVTRGSEGSNIYADGQTFRIEPARPAEVKDPTGCGDAYRAGLLFGLLNDLSWEDTGRVASVLGARKIECRGTQNHSFTRQSVAEDFATNYGRTLEI